MKLIVNPHKIQITKEPINEREINITKCEFEFAEEITNNYVKEAYFTLNDETYKQIIFNNECDIPSEVLEKKGTVQIGVVAYLVENEEEIKRYNPSPAYFDTWIGSLKDNAENSEPITPSEMEQFEQELHNGLSEVNDKLDEMDEALTEVDNLDIDATKSGSVSTVTITNKEGITKSVEIVDGEKGENGLDAKINGVNTLTIEAGTNITLDQEGNILTINSTGGGSGGTTDYSALTNKPKINNVELNGNKTSSDLGLQPAGNYAEMINNTATGSIAHIEDGANNYSINSLITDINHIQNLHGYNSPWVGGEGKNLLDPSKVSTITAYGLTITFSNNVFSISGTPTTQSTSLSFNIIDYSDYSLSGKNYVIQALENSGTPIKSIYGFRTEQEKRIAIVFDSVANPTINTTFKLSVSTTSQTVWSPYENICPITGWTGATISQSGEDTSNPTTRNISWQSEAGIIYGGTLDVISGVLTVTDQNIESYNGENLPSTWISDRDVYSVGETPTIGAQVVYKLATPATYQLPPQEIKTVLGINNIWSNTGNATVNYKADTKLYIDNKFDILSNQITLLDNRVTLLEG